MFWINRQDNILQSQLQGSVHSSFLQHFFFFKIYIAQKVCTACSWTSYKIVPLTKLNKYLYNDILDTAAINAQILYKEVAGNTIIRQNFKFGGRTSARLRYAEGISNSS